MTTTGPLTAVISVEFGGVRAVRVWRDDVAERRAQLVLTVDSDVPMDVTLDGHVIAHITSRADDGWDIVPVPSGMIHVAEYETFTAPSRGGAAPSVEVMRGCAASSGSDVLVLTLARKYASEQGRVFALVPTAPLAEGVVGA